jgi:hypothetical protein
MNHEINFHSPKNKEKSRIARSISIANESPEQRVKRCRKLCPLKSIEARKSKGIFKGENHNRALCWSLKSPDGIVYQFKSLNNWCANNQHLFDEAYQGFYKGKARAARTLYLLSPRRKRCCEVVLGWTWHINHEVSI